MNFVPPINLVASQARSRQSDEASNGEMPNEKNWDWLLKREKEEKKSDKGKETYRASDECTVGI